MKLGYSIFLVAGVFVVVAAWDNGFDQDLTVECPTGQAFRGVKSVHSNKAEDRVWEFSNYCQDKASLAHGQACNWHRGVNSWDGYLDFKCADGGTISSVHSVHNNKHEDRVWDYECCYATWPYTCTTRNRVTSGYINGFDGDMDWTTTKYIEGFVSYHDNGREDRRWRVHTVDINCEETCGCPGLLDNTWNVKEMTYDINYGEIAQGTPMVLHMVVFDNSDSKGTGTEQFVYSETKTFTSTYETSSEVGITTGFSFSVGVPEVSSYTGYVEVSAAFGQTWGQTEETSVVYSSSSSVEVPPGRIVRMTATVKQGNLNVPFTMTLEKMGCSCVVSGTWYGVTYFDKRTDIDDITDESGKRSVEERSTNDEESGDTECGQGPDGWECKANSVKFVEFDEYSIASSAVNAANKMAGKTASECFKECQVDSNCVGVIRKSSATLEDSDECYSVGQPQITSGCKPDDAMDNAFVVWIEQGRKHDCEFPHKS